MEARGTWNIYLWPSKSGLETQWEACHLPWLLGPLGDVFVLGSASALNWSWSQSLARCLPMWLHYLPVPSGLIHLGHSAAVGPHCCSGGIGLVIVLLLLLLFCFFLVFVFMELGQCCPVFRTISIAPCSVEPGAHERRLTLPSTLDLDEPLWICCRGAHCGSSRGTWLVPSQKDKMQGPCGSRGRLCGEALYIP